ncbi:hypothetical protein [Rhodopirellula halodulae]|nr:hypothetical protein [Rhodopirellula sp. JC740]
MSPRTLGFSSSRSDEWKHSAGGAAAYRRRLLAMPDLAQADDSSLYE